MCRMIGMVFRGCRSDGSKLVNSIAQRRCIMSLRIRVNQLDRAVRLILELVTLGRAFRLRGCVGLGQAAATFRNTAWIGLAHRCQERLGDSSVRRDGIAGRGCTS